MQPLIQAGAVPWRTVDGDFEILLITSRNSGRWVVPKGMIEPHLGPLQSAIEEAWEEGGVRGRADPISVGCYSYKKWGQPREVVLYALQVTHVLDHWPEQSERKRRWVPLHDAPVHVGEPDLARALTEVARGRPFV